MRRRYRAIGSPTQPQQRQQDLQREHGCAMCRLMGFQPDACGYTTIHHRTIGDLHGNKQLGQDCTVGLGAWHHMGIPHAGLQAEAMREAFGPSLHHHKRDFLAVIADHLGERSTDALQRWQDAAIARRDRKTG